MTIEEAKYILKENMDGWIKSPLVNVDERLIKANNMAIKSLEAWEKVEKEIDDSILICQVSAQNNIWNDGELAGFLQSKDIINENLSEVSE